MGKPSDEQIIELIAKKIYTGDSSFNQEGGFTPHWDMALEKAEDIWSTLKEKHNLMPVEEITPTILSETDMRLKIEFSPQMRHCWKGPSDYFLREYEHEIDDRFSLIAQAQLEHITRGKPIYRRVDV